MATFPYPHFSIAERDARWARVRAMMAQESLDVVVAPNNTGHSTDFQADARYLSHVGGGGDSDIACIFPLTGDVTVAAKDGTHRWLTTQDWVTDVRDTAREYGDVVIDRIKELGAERGRIGVSGMGPGNRTPEGTILYLQMKKLLETFPDATFVDCTSQMQEVRSVKSDEEVACLTKSTELIEHAIEAKVAAAQPGAKDYEVWAEAIYAMIKRGSELPVHYNWVSGPESHRTLSRPSHRTLALGDRIEDELEASWQGYRAQCVQPVWVGQCEPIYHDLIKIQREVFNGVLEALRPGVTVGELFKATEQAVREASPASGPLAGCTAGLAMHGRGQGDDRPLVTNPKASSRSLNLQLQERNVFILKPRVATADRKHGVNWGDTVAIGPNGGYRLGTRAHDIRVSVVVPGSL
ncbi:MAG: Xaa-Pro dipeptidase [Chloroflexota bacterium]|jgi:Xaa-Pro aminopeptidase|nr:Xaa-Pro dipeptidase [Chloroflexota bacterium]